MATLWPFVYVILFFLFVFSSVVFPPTEAPGPPPLIALILPLHLLTMLLIVGLMIFYVVNVFRNDRVDKDKKVLWLLVLLLGGGIGMPVYWYLYIWKDAPVTPGAPSQLRSSEASTLNVDMRAAPREAEYVPPREPPDWR